jgi:hypothetical protein
MKNAVAWDGHDGSHFKKPLSHLDSPSSPTMSRLSYLALFAATTFALQRKHRLAPRSIMANGPYGTCPVPIRTVYTTVFSGLGGDATASTTNILPETSPIVAPSQEELTKSVTQPSALRSTVVQIELSSMGAVSSAPSVGIPSTHSVSLPSRSFSMTFIDVSVPASIYTIGAAPTFSSLTEEVSKTSGAGALPLVADMSLLSETVTDLDVPVVLGVVQNVDSSIFDNTGETGDGNFTE